MTIHTKTTLTTLFIVLAGALLFSAACYRAEQTRQAAALAVSCSGAHCSAMFGAFK